MSQKVKQISNVSMLGLHQRFHYFIQPLVNLRLLALHVCVYRIFSPEEDTDFPSPLCSLPKSRKS